MKGVMTMRRLTAVLIAVFMTAAFAQNVIVNPQGIVVNPKPSFEVEVWLDKSGSEPGYDIGEEIEISVRTNKDAYVYLFNIRDRKRTRLDYSPVARSEYVLCV